MRTRVEGLIKPLLGYLKVELYYSPYQSLEKYTLDSGGFFSNPFTTKYESTNRLKADDIKEYQFSKAVLYFEDMLHLFSFPAIVEFSSSLTNYPITKPTNTKEHIPYSSQEQQVRIEELRKIQGEWLNYKKFEGSDDVRRIVWKIYAKSKELVVRYPEQLDPFASHIQFFVSYYYNPLFLHPNDYTYAMLNTYKIAVWNIWYSLFQHGIQVHFTSDQSVSEDSFDAIQTKQLITQSDFQHETKIMDKINLKKCQVLCIHSMNDENDIQWALDNMQTNTLVFFIQLSSTFRMSLAKHWIKKIFWLPSSDKLSSLKASWNFNPLKFSLNKNEKAILSLLEKNKIKFEVI
ncbi:MAG: hypothetical protein R2831_09625 [Chitinophagaceae bacterium]